MRVILLEDVESVGSAGDIVEVASGFARKVLFPQGKAAAATSGRVAETQKASKRKQRKAEEELAALQRVVETVDHKTVAHRTEVGPQGKLHGAVTADDIARTIAQSFSVPLPNGSVRLAEPIHEPGTYHVTLEFPHNLEAEVTVIVEAMSPEKSVGA